MTKRLFDIVGSVLALTILSPVLLVVAVLVRARLGSPVLFIQDRPGLNGRIFRLYKVRTMTNERDDRGRLLPDEARLTPLGRFLRAASFDEFPEFWNVLRGEMSLVGPRPLLVEYLDRYTAEQSRRHEVRPGITGLAQVSGRNDQTWDERLAMDVWYVDNRSTWLDLKILGLTVLKVLKREGISRQGHATMPAFEGEGADDRCE